MERHTVSAYFKLLKYNQICLSLCSSSQRLLSMKLRTKAMQEALDHALRGNALKSYALVPGAV